jgi:DNA-binding Lrp family transcriptional regulator
LTTGHAGPILDETDRQIAAALMVSPRASWRAVARVLDVSERTIVRRATRLVEDGTLRTTAIRNPARFARIVPMALRIRCRPERVMAIAVELARRPGAVRVDILGGGNEISGVLFLESPQERNSLLLRDLPTIVGIRSWDAHDLLRVFPAGFTWSGGLLTVKQVEALSPYPHEPEDAPEIQARDEALIDQLTIDARVGYGELAELLDSSGSTVRRRLERLIAAHMVRLICDVDRSLLGFASEALLWIATGPANLEAVGDALSRHPQVRFTAATTGAANLLVAVVAENLDGLYTFLARTIGALNDIRVLDVTPILETVSLYPRSLAGRTADIGLRNEESAFVEHTAGVVVATHAEGIGIA